ncbi:hypothetical protein MRX96_009249 [Rhipicephalus microplus]
MRSGMVRAGAGKHSDAGVDAVRRVAGKMPQPPRTTPTTPGARDGGDDDEQRGENLRLRERGGRARRRQEKENADTACDRSAARAAATVGGTESERTRRIGDGSKKRMPPVTFSPLPLRTRSAQEPPCISGWGGLWKRTVPCGSLDWLLECDGPLDWDRRRSLDRDLARPLDEVPFRWPWERLLDRDLDLDRLLACCDESRLSTPVAAERLFELELRCAVCRLAHTLVGVSRYRLLTTTL